MFLLRRTALRAAMSATKPTPSLIVPKARTFVSLNQSKLRPAARWTASTVQRRFASDDAAATKIDDVANAVEAAEPAEVVEEVLTEAAPEAGTSAAAAASAIAGAATSASTGQPGATDQPVNTTLYVGNIFYEVNEQSLEDYFGRFGQINKTRIVYDSRGLSKGFGYVEFQNVDAAVRAVETANQQVFQGRRLSVQHHRPRRPLKTSNNNEPSKTLFIGNMSFEMSDKDLSDLFRDVRNVIDVRIAIDRRTGQPRGFAHADFVDVASATKAMEFLRNKDVYGRTLRVDYSASTPRTRSE